MVRMHRLPEGAGYNWVHHNKQAVGPDRDPVDKKGRGLLVGEWVGG
jgi:hypothetical protein